MFPARKQIVGGHKFSDDREGAAVVTCILITQNTNVYDEATEECPTICQMPQLLGGLCG